MARDGESGGEGISRRTLLVGGGAGAGLLLAWTFWPRRYDPNLRTAESETLFDAYLKIGRDGRVVVAVPQAELGQGVWTGLPQILADELGADWRTVAVEPSPIGPLYANPLINQPASDPGAWLGVDRVAWRRYVERGAAMVTLGSTSVRAFEAPLRRAGAAARALLSIEAADRWSADWRELDTREGFVWRGRDRLSFAELAEAASGRDLPDDLPVRGGLGNRLVGQPLPRLDLPAKLDGSAMFAGDIRLPDMVYAAVRSAPEGSVRRPVDAAAADDIPGALAVIENPGWIAVAATNWWAAARALDALSPRYELPDGLPTDATIAAALDAALDSGDETRVHEQGEADGPFPGASEITARYDTGLLPAAALEPLTATARMAGDRLEIWAPTQAPGLARAAAARAIGFSASRVTLHPVLVGGGYGRKLEVDAIAQAAILARRLDRPVQLTWPRIQEIQFDTLAPPAAARMRAWVAGGAIAGWHALIASPSAAATTAARIGASPRFFEPYGGPAAGAAPAYDIPAAAIDHVEVDIGLATGLARGGPHLHTAFFTECFVDELARAAGVEPLSFRMQMLGGNPRLARVLQTATAIGGWDGGPPGSGMGIAVHSAFGGHAAILVEIELTGEQRIRVLRAVCAVDCGRIVNPELVRQQVEGGILHGVAAATGAPVSLANGLPAFRNVRDYGLPTLRDAPEIAVELLESADEPAGVTELAVPTAAPAIANALFSLTGQRRRTLPLLPGVAP